MPLRLAVVCALTISPLLAAKTVNDLDSESVSWLLSQINIGEVQQNKQLVADSLQKLLAVAPQHIETQCALARYYFNNDAIVKAEQLLTNLLEQTTSTQACIAQLQLIANITGQSQAEVQRAKLLARAGQYLQASTIYTRLFKQGYPSLNYELEHLSWYAQDSTHWQPVNKRYTQLFKRYPGVGEIAIAHARHLLRRDNSDKQAIDILSKYGTTSRFSNEVEGLWLNTLKNMPVARSTEQQYQHYFTVYPFSSKGSLQFQNFKQALLAQQQLLADPGYQLWLRGDKLVTENKFKAAEPLLLKALQSRPTDSAIMRSLGTLYLRLGEHETAHRYFSNAQKQAVDFNEREVLKGLAKTAKFWLYIREAKQAIAADDYHAAQLQLNLADALQEDPNTVLYHRGFVLYSQGHYAQAARIYQQILNDQPLNSSALTGLLNIVKLDNSEQSLTAFYAGLTAAQKQVVAADYRTAMASNLRDKANDYYNLGDVANAENTLKQAISLAPEQPWLYYDLALVYQQQGLTEQARSVYNNVLWQYPLNAQLRYSHALFLRTIDDYEGALTTLDYIPFKDRDEQVINLEQQLKINQALAQSERHLTAQQKSTAIYQLTNLEAQPLTPLMRAKLASNWYQIDEHQRALTHLNRALTTAPSLAPYWHILYGQWLLNQGDKTSTEQWLSDYQLPEDASASDINQYVQLRTAYIQQYYRGDDLIAKLNQLDQRYKHNATTTTALLNANVALGHHQAAIILYQQKLHNNQVIEPQALMTIATAYQALGDDTAATNVMLQAINQTDAQQGYLQQQMMTALNEFNTADDALFLAQQLIDISPNDQQLRYLAAQLAEQFDQQQQATTWYQQTLAPQQTLTEQQLYASLAQLDEQDAWYINGAKRALINQQQQNQAYIAVGVNFSGQTSTASEATLGAGQVPIEAYFPLWQGQGFVKLDPTRVSAQTTRFDEQFAGSRYGQGALCIFDSCSGEITPEQSGIDIGLGWQNDNWRFDIGTTPLGFLVEDIVWGINYNNKLGDFGYRFELEKRPVTSSVLSYAGLTDIKTGEVWGGVRSTGLSLNVSHDLGGDWGFWSSADFQLYNGQNVKDNQRYRLMGGSYYRVISNQQREFTVGASVLHWAYKFNLSEETYGHGGYYSPQNYIGLSLPLSYDARWGDDFVYRLRAGVGVSTTKTHSIDFFPNDRDLQIAAYNREPITGVSPVFEGGTSSGVSYNLGASFEYRVTPHWFFGGYLSIDRADFYQPNFGQLYLRYYFNPVYGRLEFPGTPIIPYADF
ncbi:cellulose synthase subunit BcsC-related outer membrane protein [Pseudoalteromonas sp.]|uniref:cellulose synthase subunit BcsC-related outer membrane protein n=1 Tax=Pseudoalteromonas sp. TaxID=53249 RepID=UPI003565CFB2